MISPDLILAAAEPANQVALFSLLSLAITTLGGIAVAWIALQQAKLNKTVQTVKETVQTVEKNTNSMREALVESTAKASKSEGVLQEKQDEAVRKAEIVIAIGQAASPSTQPPKPAVTEGLAKAIKDVPEKTATKVVEKLAEK